MGDAAGESERQDAAAAAPPKANAELRTAMDLLANRVHASSYQNGHLIIDAGSTDILKYTDGGWKTSWIFGRSDEGHIRDVERGTSHTRSGGVDFGNRVCPVS